MREIEGAECPFNFDLERMQESVDSGVISFPRGLTREQRRQYIAEVLKEIDKHECTTVL